MERPSEETDGDPAQLRDPLRQGWRKGHIKTTLG